MHNSLENIISNSDFSVEVYESDLYQYHFLIRYIPGLSISQIVRRLKQQYTYQIWRKNSAFLGKEFWREQTFCSDGYFVCSIGEASADTIQGYILNQG